MTAKSNIENQAATGILIGAVCLFSFAFLRTEDMIVSVACMLAVLGWVGWWYERTSEREYSEEADSPVETESPIESAAEDAADSTPVQTIQSRLAAFFKRNKTEPSEILNDASQVDNTVLHKEVEDDVTEIASQIVTARVEAEQAVNAAVESFGTLVNQAHQIEECSQEVASWQHDKDPMHTATIGFLLERSSELRQSVNKLVMAFQFNDLLSQRLTHTEKSLYRITARLHGEEVSGDTKSLSFAEGPVIYETEQQDDITLF